MKTLDDARALARSMVDTGKRMGVPTVALLTDMNQPLGRMAGNANEVNESVDALIGKGPADLMEVTLELGAELLVLAKRESTTAAADLLAGLVADHALPERDRPAAVGSPAAQFGHLGGAAPMVALLKAGLEVQQGQVAAAFGVHQPAGVFQGSAAAQPARTQIPLNDSRLGAVVSWSKGQRRSSSVHWISPR